MPNNPLFTVNRLDRKPEFALVTSIYKNDDGKMFVVKRPANGHFSDHFNSIFDSPSKLTPISKGSSSINIIKPSPLGGAVMFPFIRGRNVERILLDKVLADDQAAVRAIIQKFLLALDKFPVKNCTPTNDPQYKSIFGGAFSAKLDCVTPGIVDLNLDNLIEDESGDWHLVDYEWTFDFAVPKDYLISRLFLGFFILRYESLLRSHAGRIKQVEVGEGHSMPLYIAETYDKWIKLFPKVLETESSFQSYVLYRKESLGDFKYIAPEHRKLIDPAPQLVDDYLDLQLVKSRLEAENQSLATQLADMSNSRAYKAARKVSKLRNTLRKNN